MKLFDYSELIRVIDNVEGYTVYTAPKIERIPFKFLKIRTLFYT